MIKRFNLNPVDYETFHFEEFVADDVAQITTAAIDSLDTFITFQRNPVQSDHLFLLKNQECAGKAPREPGREVTTARNHKSRASSVFCFRLQNNSNESNNKTSVLFDLLFFLRFFFLLLFRIETRKHQNPSNRVFHHRLKGSKEKERNNKIDTPKNVPGGTYTLAGHMLRTLLAFQVS